MSRTKKGSKSPGAEHCSRRPKSFVNDKNITVRAERREHSKEVAKALMNIFFDLNEDDEFIFIVDGKKIK